jgi:hypothetical protein
VLRKTRLFSRVNARFTSLPGDSARHGSIEQDENSRAMSAVIARGPDFDNIPISFPGLCNPEAEGLPRERIHT